MSQERFKLIAAVHLLLFREGNVLLARRCNTGWSDGMYSVPAGHVDGGETMRQAMAREAREEVGLVIEPLAFKVVHVMHRISDGSERVDFFLTADEWAGEPEIKEVDKCDDLQWFGVDELPKNTIPYIKLAVEEVTTGVIYSEVGWD